MSVTLSPTQLGFERPLTRLVKKVLIIKNSNNHSIAFKVKTTSPKLFCVRPNAGRIESNESVEVQVLLQPMREDPPIGTKCRDKFLVQTVSITPERENATVAELWTIIEAEDKALTDKSQASIHEQKIRCTYLNAPDEAKDESSRISTPPSTSEQSSIVPSTTTLPTPSVVETIAPISQIQSRSNSNSTPSSVLLESTTSTPSPPSPPSPPLPTEEFLALQSELKAAKAEVAKLRQQIVDSEVITSELRKRNVAANAAIVAAKEEPRAQVAVETKPQAASGVPLPVVVGVVVSVFVVTWLFL